MKTKSLRFLAMAALLAGLAANALLFPAPVYAQSSTPLTNMPTANGWVYAVVPDGAGGVYIGGYFTQLTLAPVHGGGTVTRNYVAHVLADGTVDPAWNPNANGYVFALAVSGTTVYAGGFFNNIGGAARNNMAALDATTGNATAWNPNADAPVRALAVSGSTVYAGGGHHHWRGGAGVFCSVRSAANPDREQGRDGNRDGDQHPGRDQLRCGLHGGLRHQHGGHPDGYPRCRFGLCRLER